MKVACIQMNAQDDLPTNIVQADGLMDLAAQGGAQLICLPENAFFMRGDDAAAMPVFAAAEHPGVQHCAARAKQWGAWVLIGSIAAPASNGKWFNQSVLLNPQGSIAALYNKIHLFDVTLPSGEVYAESVRFAAGDKAVLADLSDFRLGMTVCYDVRFPQLYRTLAQAGASLLAVPAAFTATTGAAHWHSLLRARAIENGCYVIAAAQCGTHPKGRKTFGHSLIIDPWGEVLADGGSEVGYVLAEIDPAQVQKIRGQIPSLQHDRVFTLSSPPSDN